MAIVLLLLKMSAGNGCEGAGSAFIQFMKCLEHLENVDRSLGV